MAEVGISDLEGGDALVAWFGETPSFHDAKLSRLEIRQGSASTLVFHIFKAGPEVDARGYFVQTKHAQVTLSLLRVTNVELHEMTEAAIVFDLTVERGDGGFTVRWDSSYGASGQITAHDLSLSFAPEPQSGGPPP